MKRCIAVVVATLLLSVTLSHAHLTLNSLSLKKSETFNKGDSVVLTWKMDHAHPNYKHYIYVRLDSTKSWECVDSVPASNGTDYKYTWKIPGVATKKGQLFVHLPEYLPGTVRGPSKTEYYNTIFSSEFAIELKEQQTAVKPEKLPAASVPVKKEINAADKKFTLDGRSVSAGQLQLLENNVVPHLIILEKKK
jgi:hypothetical protein